MVGAGVAVIPSRIWQSNNGFRQINSDITNNGLPQWLSGKEPACSAGEAGDMGSIPESGRSPGGGHGNPLQYSCLENPMDKGGWQATVHRVAKSQA